MSKTHRGECRIGTSGYEYKHWRGPFYPKGLPQQKRFDYYAERFDTVEINNTFYNLPEASTFDAWRERAPDEFRYALKFSRYGSHMKKLKAPEETIGLFMERARRLKSFLGPVLLQLPPRWKCNPERLDRFLSETPSDARWAVEFRDPSWLCPEIYAILRKHGAALCIHDMIPGHPREITADWTYLRFHGDHYTGSYSHQFLSAQARRLQDYLDDRLDVYAYFNNDEKAYAVSNALDLRRYVGPD